jgi:hypothetical protein
MERRTAIRLAGRDIYIDSCPETTLALADQNLVGDSDLVSDIIRIRHDLTDEQWDEVLLHELLHFVWHVTPLPHLCEEHEETVIRAIAPWLNTIIRVRSH